MTRPFAWRSTLGALAALLFVTSQAHAARVGETIADFTVQDATGKTHQLADFKGKYVVLEWHNSGCPFVKKHYVSGNMQKLQKEWTGKGVVWLTINSSAKGKEGYEEGAALQAEMTQVGAAPTAAIVDAKGDLGHKFGAKTTPHMFIISPQGKLLYTGAIDDKEGTDVGEIAGAKNYVAQALTESMAGNPVSESSTRPYGCSVKY